jgi:NADH dehydrogenase
MTYQPFLPEVTAGSVEARHAAVSLRRHLRRARLIAGTVTAIRHADRTITVRPAKGADYELRYDTLVVTAGAVTRTFPIPGLAQHAIGLKHVEEAVAIRDRLMTAFDQAASLPPGAERRRLLTVTFVGGGFSGVEGFGELLSLATAMLKSYPELNSDELSFHMVEARGRILPEVGDKPGAWVVRSLERRGAHVHLNTQIHSLADGHVVLSNGEEFDSALVVWTAGNASNPVVHNHSDLPIDERGLLVVRPGFNGAGGSHGAERPARRTAGQTPREEHRGRPARGADQKLPPQQFGGGGDLGAGTGHLPVQEDRHQGTSRLADAPGLSRPGRALVGT